MADQSQDTVIARRFQATSIALTVVAVVLLVSQGTDIRPSLEDVGMRYYRGILAVSLMFLLGHLVIRRGLDMRHGSAQQGLTWYQSYFSPVRLADILCALFAVVVTISCFTVYKTNVVGSDGYGYDALFIAWDRWIFAGRDAWEVSHGILPSAQVTRWSDFLYHPTFIGLLISYIICVVFLARPALRYTFMLSYLASFVFLGMVMAAQLHSAGPIFDGVIFGDGEGFAPLMARLEEQDVEAGPFVFLLGKEYLLRVYDAGISAAAGGISAMPSMHVVLASLCAIGLWHVSAILGALATLYAIAIWFGSVHLGWHYFVDGLIGLAGLAIIWLVCARLMGLYARPQVMRATT